jgi:hypothetical protein
VGPRTKQLWRVSGDPIGVDRSFLSDPWSRHEQPSRVWPRIQRIPRVPHGSERCRPIGCVRAAIGWPRGIGVGPRTKQLWRVSGDPIGVDRSFLSDPWSRHEQPSRVWPRIQRIPRVPHGSERCRPIGCVRAAIGWPRGIGVGPRTKQLWRVSGDPIGVNLSFLSDPWSRHEQSSHVWPRIQRIPRVPHGSERCRPIGCVRAAIGWPRGIGVGPRTKQPWRVSGDPIGVDLSFLSDPWSRHEQSSRVWPRIQRIPRVPHGSERCRPIGCVRAAIGWPRGIGVGPRTKQLWRVSADPGSLIHTGTLNQ